MSEQDRSPLSSNELVYTAVIGALNQEPITDRSSSGVEHKVLILPTEEFPRVDALLREYGIYGAEGVVIEATITPPTLHDIHDKLVPGSTDVHVNIGYHNRADEYTFLQFESGIKGHKHMGPMSWDDLVETSKPDESVDPAERLAGRISLLDIEDDESDDMDLEEARKTLPVVFEPSTTEDVIRDANDFAQRLLDDIRFEDQIDPLLPLTDDDYAMLLQLMEVARSRHSS